MKNNGTIEGTKQEEEFIKDFNFERSSIFDFYIQDLNIKNLDSIFMVRTNVNVYSKLSSKMVFPKSDAILIECKEDLKSLKDFDYTEKSLIEKGINYKKINYSGISIKLIESKSFQIMKIRPETFRNLFGDNVLAAGASIYSEKLDELGKNFDILLGWDVEIDLFLDYFSDFIKNKLSLVTNLEICKKIKTFSTNELRRQIIDDIIIQKKIFTGEGIFDEPYVAKYIYKNGKVTLNGLYDFYVTTGSGRSKKNYTLVIKPKQS